MNMTPVAARPSPKGRRATKGGASSPYLTTRRGRGNRTPGAKPSERKAVAELLGADDKTDRSDWRARVVARCGRARGPNSECIRR